MGFLDRLDQLMSANGLNKSSLSKLSGIPYMTIDSFYKKGYENVKLSTLKKLAAALNVSLDYLVSDDFEGGHQSQISMDDAERLVWFRNLVEMKNDSGLTTEEISERSGIPRGTLNKLFAGQTHNPQLETMRSLVHSLGYTLNDLEDKDNPYTKCDMLEAWAEILVNRYKSLDDDGRGAVDAILNYEMSRKFKNEMKQEREQKKIQQQKELEESDVVVIAAEGGGITRISKEQAKRDLYAEVPEDTTQNPKK